MVGIVEIPAVESFNVYPIPNNGLFTASIRNPLDLDYTIKVYDQLGGTIFELPDVKTTGGKFDTQIDLRPASRGIYYVVFINGRNKVIRRTFVNE